MNRSTVKGFLILIVMSHMIMGCTTTSIITKEYVASHPSILTVMNKMTQDRAIAEVKRALVESVRLESPYKKWAWRSNKRLSSRYLKYLQLSVNSVKVDSLGASYTYYYSAEVRRVWLYGNTYQTWSQQRKREIKVNFADVVAIKYIRRPDSTDGIVFLDANAHNLFSLSTRKDAMDELIGALLILCPNVH